MRNPLTIIKEVWASFRESMDPVPDWERDEARTIPSARVQPIHPWPQPERALHVPFVVAQPLREETFARPRWTGPAGAGNCNCPMPRGYKGYCVLPAGHDGLHRILNQTWETPPEADQEPALDHLLSSSFKAANTAERKRKGAAKAFAASCPPGYVRPASAPVPKKTR